jgi:hypothetical protein
MQRMIRTVVGIMGVLILLSSLQAQNKPETPTPAQQYQKLVQEYQTALTEFRKAYADAKTEEDKRKVVLEKQPLGEYLPRFLELAEKNPKDPTAVDALIWIITHGGGWRPAAQGHPTLAP